MNAGCRFFDKRIGQSTTLTGRQIVKHMTARVNEIITGEYSHTGASIQYGDTDSQTGDTMHYTNSGYKSVETLFEECETFYSVGSKEYAVDPDLMVLSYNSDLQEPYMGHIEYIYRHKVTKNLYEIEDASGNIITVTEDHSVMVERDGRLIAVTPLEILDTDILISVSINNV